MNELKHWLFDPQWTQFLLKLKSLFLNPTNITDVGLVLALVYMMLLVIAERRTLWMVRGFIFLMVAAAVSQWLHLKLLSFVLNNLVIGSARTIGPRRVTHPPAPQSTENPGF
jgi:DNA integrity scanning protein DisA with diadenylate cyclase activity